MPFFVPTFSVSMIFRFNSLGLDIYEVRNDDLEPEDKTQITPS